MKAVLVIDVEEKDIGRKVNYVSVQGGGLSYIVGTMGEDVRLRPLPKEWEIDYDLDFGGDIDFGMGWNHCLQEITGEAK